MHGTRTFRTLTLAILAATILAAVAPRTGAQGTLTALETDVDQIARNVAPSVVTVIAQRTVVQRRNRSKVANQRLHTRVGSGVAAAENLVLTTASVVLGAERVVVRTSYGQQVEGTVIGSDLVYNIAVVKVAGVALTPVKFSDRVAQTGDWIIAFGTSYRGQPTQSVGTVATIFSDPRQPLIQLTNTVYPGNSGGAAVNARGELVGLIQGELGSPELSGREPGADRRPGGMSFVQPVQVMRAPFETLRRDGRVPHGFLGVSTRSASVASDAEPGARVPIGAMVEAVHPDGPAMRAGLRKGDLIVGFDRERVEYADHVARWVASTRPSTAVEVVWVRDEIQHHARVVLGESPAAGPQWMANKGSGTERIQDLQKQVDALNQEIRRLRAPAPAGR